MTDKPKPVWVTTTMGGEYIPWREWSAAVSLRRERSIQALLTQAVDRRIHSVGFDDGSVFDNTVGWRSWPMADIPLELRQRFGLENDPKAPRDRLADLSREVAELRRDIEFLRRHTSEPVALSELEQPRIHGDSPIGWYCA